MTEGEWLTDTDGAALAMFWGEQFTERKGRLLMLACCHRRKQHLVSPIACEALAALTAHYADPNAGTGPLDDAYLVLYNRLGEIKRGAPPDAVFWAVSALEGAVRPNSVLARVYGQRRSWLVPQCLCDAAGHDGEGPLPGEREAQAYLVREIVGNPFRPVAFDPLWRTDTALALARQMYASEDFGAAPILADALQDAGCDSADLPGHLRNPNAAHVRGCWAVDLVLGKQ